MQFTHPLNLANSPLAPLPGKSPSPSPSPAVGEREGVRDVPSDVGGRKPMMTSAIVHPNVNVPVLHVTRVLSAVNRRQLGPVVLRLEFRFVGGEHRLYLLSVRVLPDP